MSEMTRTMVIGKIHRARVTGADLHYVGSITIDEDLLDAANIVPGQKVDIADVNNGSRLSTYTIAGQRGSGHHYGLCPGSRIPGSLCNAQRRFR